MFSWFRRNRPAPVEAVRDFVDTMEFMNVLLARELAQNEAASNFGTPFAQPSAGQTANV